MSEESTLVIVVDGLRASALGAYGNTWFDTPSVDRLAADSWLAEWCFVSAVQLPDVYHALWQGVHPAHYGADLDELAALIAAVGDRFHTHLITDSNEVAALAAKQPFEQVELLEDLASGVCNEIEETRFAHLVAAAADALREGAAHKFVWLHSRGMYGSWDAPLELREALVEEGDPAPYPGHESPVCKIDRAANPDDVFAFACAYAAQVQSIDACLGALLAEVPKNINVVFTGGRGFPLGEHGQVGGTDLQLPVEQLHVPLILRSGTQAGRLGRAQALVEPCDLPATLLNWAGIRDKLHFNDGWNLMPLVDGHPDRQRDHSVATSEQARAIRTPSWCLREFLATPQGADGEAAVQLFVRPDDRFEVNNVATLQATIAEGLLSALDDFHAACAQPGPLMPAPLAESLRTPVR